MIPMNTPKIYDGMVLFQKLPATLSTFGDISDFLINKIVKGSCRVCFFCDRLLSTKVSGKEE